MKVVINKCYGGFSLSNEAVELFYKLKHNKQAYHFDSDGYGETQKYKPSDGGLFSYSFDVPNPNDFDSKVLWNEHHLDNRPEDRSDPILVQVCEQLGTRASGDLANLAVVEIPDDVEWYIHEYDGYESVEEKHRSWG